MNRKKFERLVGEKIINLKAENRANKNSGRFKEYQLICSELSGISFVMDNFYKIKKF